ncbi:MAG TPA: glycoside hydrolase family 13 protein [bacterium]
MNSKAAILILLLAVTPAQSQQTVPEWAKGAVWYQIFPERFRNGSPANDPLKAEVVGDRPIPWQTHPWTSNWYQLQPWEAARSSNFYDVVFDRRYGGDLIGVIEELPYLKELGVDVIYFNPIFEAQSLHKYEATTYHHIDNNFGNDRDGDRAAIHSEKADPAAWTFTSADHVFFDLIKKAHEMGIKIVIDGVFNHCGRDFWAFQDVLQNQQQSAYKHWFDIVRWDDPVTAENEFDYKGWWGYKGMPEFKEDENGLVPPVRDYVYSITRRWMDPNGDGNPGDGIDGWRLDVAKDVTPKFWEDWNSLVKTINPQAIVVAEIWEEAPDWVTGKRVDSMMNYPLAKAMEQFFIDQQTRTSVSQFDAELARLREVYPEETNHILMNLIDSHDTDRVASMIRNPDRNYDREAGPRGNPNYDPRKPTRDQRQIQKLIAVFQLTYLGAPSIYYGSEAGMWGADDPDDRKPMLWEDRVFEKESYGSVRPDLKAEDDNRFDRELFAHYQKLIKIRHDYPAIQRGTFITRLTDDERGVYAFARKLDQSEVIIVLNNSGVNQEIEIPIIWKKQSRVQDLLNARVIALVDGMTQFQLPPKWAAILVPVKN